MRGRVAAIAAVSAAALVLGSLPAHGAASLVKNINKADPAGSEPQDFVPLGKRMYFAAEDATHGRELWASNGKKKKTKLVIDLDPEGSASPRDLTLFGNSILFRATDGSSGHELWRTDGTKGGTVLVSDIAAGPAGSTPSFLANDETTDIVPIGTYAYFAAADVNGDVELWRTDGTPTYTSRVADINPTGSSNPTQLTAVGTTLFFRADDGTHGRELYSLDTSGTGTPVLIDIRPGNQSPNDSNPASLEALGNTLFFAANNGTSGRELMTIEPGQTSSTVIDINQGPASSFPTEVTAMGDAVFFAANGTLNVDIGSNSGVELWKSDGTPNGTKVVLFIGRGTGSNPSHLTVAGNLLYLRATQDGDAELWRSDGVSRYEDLQHALANTIELEINPSDSSEPTALSAVDGSLFLTANDGTNGAEPWRSDGTQAGTALVANIAPGDGGGGGTTYARFSTKVFFDGFDPVRGTELWVTGL